MWYNYLAGRCRPYCGDRQRILDSYMSTRVGQQLPVTQRKAIKYNSVSAIHVASPIVKY
jgi:hypothetical protein